MICHKYYCILAAPNEGEISQPVIGDSDFLIDRWRVDRNWLITGNIAVEDPLQDKEQQFVCGKSLQIQILFQSTLNIIKGVRSDMRSMPSCPIRGWTCQRVPASVPASWEMKKAVQVPP